MPSLQRLEQSQESSQPEQLLSVEQLEQEYDKITSAREVYGQVYTTRKKIFALLRFLGSVAPNVAISKVKSMLGLHEKIDTHTLETAGIPMETNAALVDLGAFDLNRLRQNQLDLSPLKEKGIKEVVLMEDRAPQFFLNYRHYDPGGNVPLNRHGDPKQKWQMQDMKMLIDSMHAQGIKVIIGFWGNTQDHKKNEFVERNWSTLKPVIPISDDINPLSFVRNEKGEKVPFAQYVGDQYKKLKTDFQVDGLFLGDGLMGYRAFMDPHGPYNFSEHTRVWTDFYQRVQAGVKQAGREDTLWAYDCMANGTNEARRNGVDLAGITPHIDNYVFQSYGNDAWGKNFMRVPGYSLSRDQAELSTLPGNLKQKTRYPIGLGDEVEGWKGNMKDVREKHQALRSDARKGTLGVWSTELVQTLLQPAGNPSR